MNRLQKEIELEKQDIKIAKKMGIIQASKANFFSPSLIKIKEDELQALIDERSRIARS